MSITGNEDFQFETIRDAAILSAAGEYIIGNDTLATDPLWRAVKESDELNLLLNFTKGNLTNVKIEIEISFDGENFTPVAMSTPSSGDAGLEALSFTATADFAGNWKLDGVAAPYIKIKWTPTGADDTGSSLKVEAALMKRF